MERYSRRDGRGKEEGGGAGGGRRELLVFYEQGRRLKKVVVKKKKRRVRLPSRKPAAERRPAKNQMYFNGQ